MLSKCMHGWQSGAGRQRVDANPLRGEEGIAETHSASAAPLAASMLGMISSAFMTSSLNASRPSRTAAAWTRSISNLMRGLSALPRTATRLRAGTTSRNSSSLRPPRSVCMFDRPVTLPPGRARLATSPVPTGSPAEAKTIGIVDVAFLTDMVAAVPAVTMTSTLR